jgi:hypothetical protein
MKNKKRKKREEYIKIIKIHVMVSKIFNLTIKFLHALNECKYYCISYKNLTSVTKQLCKYANNLYQVNYIKNIFPRTGKMSCIGKRLHHMNKSN